MTKKPTYEELERQIQELKQAESERKLAQEALKKRIVALTMPLAWHRLSHIRMENQSLNRATSVGCAMTSFAKQTRVLPTVTNPMLLSDDYLPQVQSSSSARVVDFGTRVLESRSTDNTSPIG